MEFLVLDGKFRLIEKLPLLLASILVAVPLLYTKSGKGEEKKSGESK